MRFAVPIAVFCLVASSGASQTPPAQQPIFRAGANLVAVDVRVLDRDGKPVTDLKETDFSVFEDSLPQAIRYFAPSPLLPAAPGPVARPVARAAVFQASLEPRTYRTFLIVLGRGRLQYPAKGVDGALHLVRDRLLPQDQVAVLAYNRATDFTTDHRQIEAVLERFKKKHESIEARLVSMLRGLAAVYGSKEIPPVLQGEIDSIFRGPGSPGVREIPPGAVAAAGRIADDQRKTADTLQQVEAQKNSTSLDVNAANDAELLGLSFDEYVSATAQSMQELSNLYTGIEYLRHIEGEKHLIYVTESGMLLPRADDDRGLAARANGARVVIDTIMTGGVAPGPPLAAMPGVPRPSFGPPLTLMFRGMGAQQISQLTGGQFSQVSYADKMMDTIDRSTRFEYLLGYAPPDSRFDGRYRRIQVRVNRPGLTVLFRHGYFAAEQLPALDRQVLLTQSRISAAGAYAGQVTDIKFTPTVALTRTAAGPGTINVQLSIDLSTVALADVDGVSTGALDVSVFCGTASQQLVGESSQKIGLKLGTDTRARMLRDGLPYEVDVAVSAAPRYVKIVVYDERADKVGSVTIRIGS